jgi:hypothetical protein
VVGGGGEGSRAEQKGKGIPKWQKANSGVAGKEKVEVSALNQPDWVNLLGLLD